MDKARAESLVKWINQIDDSIPCSCLEELASGELLLKRMQKIIPELQATSSSNPWDCLLEVLEEFCDCDPSKFLDLQVLSQGDSEQIGRVLVIFLCMAVQKKPNEDIIAGITSLDPFAQRDIMFFIENTLGKMETHALFTGEFTSGIGELLPPLEEEESVSDTHEGPGLEPELDRRKVNNPAPPLPPPPSTPSRFAKHSVYDGLASPAAARWLLTPVMAKKGRPMPDTNLPPAGEEVLVLKHKVRVLEKRLETETKMARDFHTELCQLSKEHEYLKMKCVEAEGKAKQVANVQDLEDELEEYRQKLSKAEKAVARFQDEMETVVTLKKRCCELEKRVIELEPAQAKLEECQMRVENLNTLLGEQRAQIKQQQLHFGTLEVQLKVKTEQLESSIHQATRLSEEFKDLHMAQRLARETVDNLEREKEQLQEQLQDTSARLLENQQEAKVRADCLAAQVASQHSELQSALATIDTLRAQVEANEHQLSIHEREVCQLQGELQQMKVQCKKVTGEAQRLTSAILGDGEAATVAEESGSMVAYNLKRAESLWLKKLQELSSLKEQFGILQVSMGEARGAVEKMEGELKESRHNNDLLKESLSRAQLETKKTQVDLHRVAKGFADLKVNSSLLEVQLEQSRDTMEKMVQQKAAVDESWIQVKESNCLLQSELGDLKKKYLVLEADLKSALEQTSTAQCELLTSQQKLAKAVLEHQEEGLRLQGECEQQMLHLKADHESRIGQLTAQLKEESDQLKAAHGDAIGQLKREHGTKVEYLQLEQQKIIGQLQKEHELSIGQLQAEHEKVVEQLKSEFGMKMEQLKLKQEKDVEQLQAEHGTQIECLQTKHAKVVEQLNSEHGLKFEQLRSEQEKMVEQLQTELTLAYEATKSLEEQVNMKLQEAYGNITAIQVELAQVSKQLALSKEEEAVLTVQHKQNMEELLARLDQAKDAICAKEREVATLSDEVQLVREQKNKSECQLHQLRTEVESIKVKLADLAQHSASVEGELHRVEQQLATVEKEAEELQAKNVELTTNQQQLEAEMVVLVRCSEDNSQKFQSDLNEAHQLLAAAKNQAEELKKDFEEQLCITRQKLISSEEENKKLQVAHKSENEDKMAELSKLMGQLEEAQRWQRDSLQLQKDLLFVTEQKRAAECDTCNLRVELEAAKLQLVDLKKTSSQLADDKEALMEQLYSTEQQAKKVQEEIGHLKTVLKEETDRRVDLEAKYRELESHSTAIEHERAKLESDAKSNEEEHLMTMQSLQADLQRTTNELQNLTDAKLQLEMEVANAQRQVAVNNHAMAELNFTHRQFQDENTRHREHCKALEGQLKKVTEQLDNEKTMHNDAICKLENECSECRKELSLSKDKLAQQAGLYERQCGELQKENRTLLKKQSQLHEELQHVHEMKHEADRTCAEYKEALARESEMVQQMSEYKEAYTKESEKVKQLSEFKEAFLKESEKVQQLLQYKEAYLAESDRVQNMSQHIEVIQSERDEHMRNLSSSLEKEQKQTNKLAAEVKSLQAQLAYAEQRLRDIEHGRNHVTLTYNPSIHCQHAAKQDGDANSRTIAEERIVCHLSRNFDAAVKESIPVVFNEGTHPVSRRETLLSSVLMEATCVPPNRPAQQLPSIPEEDSAERIRELQRRNTKTLPHLKSSYPVELQVQSPSISDERIKAGTQPARLRSRPQSMQFDIPSDETALKRKLLKDKVDPSAGSPVPTKRRLSAPQTPSAPLQELPQHAVTRRLTTMPSGMKLREFLDEKENAKGPEVTREPMGLGTSFEVSFSSDGVQRPPQLPKRLVQRQEAREKEKKAHPLSGPTTASKVVGPSKKAPSKPQLTRAQKVLTSTN